MSVPAPRLFLLAVDHRGSFERGLFGIDGRRPTPDERASIVEAKRVVFESFLRARSRSEQPEAMAILLDDEYGNDLIVEATDQGIAVAIAAEQSGQAEFDFQHGDDFGPQLERFAPDYVKVLTRYNPAGDADLNARQANRLRRLSDWRQGQSTQLLLELIVPPLSEQIADAGGIDRFEIELRPQLMLEAVAELQDAGVEADIWKVEGLEDRADCEELAALVQRGGRSDVRCVVLGRGADDATLTRWLKSAAPVPGYTGFAIGRSIWWSSLERFLGGKAERESACEEIARRFQSQIDIYREASLAASLLPSIE